ncbi:MAG: hypothetical protein WBY93_05810, partial [Candidatus Binatus sp.]
AASRHYAAGVIKPKLLGLTHRCPLETRSSIYITAVWLVGFGVIDIELSEQRVGINSLASAVAKQALSSDAECSHLYVRHRVAYRIFCELRRNEIVSFQKAGASTWLPTSNI